MLPCLAHERVISLEPSTVLERNIPAIIKFYSYVTPLTVANILPADGFDIQQIFSWTWLGACLFEVLKSNYVMTLPVIIFILADAGPWHLCIEVHQGRRNRSSEGPSLKIFRCFVNKQLIYFILFIILDGTEAAIKSTSTTQVFIFTFS